MCIEAQRFLRVLLNRLLSTFGKQATSRTFRTDQWKDNLFLPSFHENQRFNNPMIFDGVTATFLSLASTETCTMVSWCSSRQSHLQRSWRIIYSPFWIFQRFLPWPAQVGVDAIELLSVVLSVENRKRKFQSLVYCSSHNLKSL
jgi:hypothetical protein